MARDVVDAEIIEFRDDLVEWLAAGGKPADSFRIGVEHEKFPFYTADRTPVPTRASAASGPCSKAPRRASAGRRSRTRAR